MVDAEVGFAKVSVLEGVFLFNVESVGSFLYGFGSSYIDAESRVVVGVVVEGLGRSGHVLVFFLVFLGAFNSPFLCLYSLRSSFVFARFLSGRY